MPAQPPFLTPTRTPTSGRPALPMTSWMRCAAASDKRITWGLGREVAISISFSIGFKGRSSTPDIGVRPRHLQLAHDLVGEVWNLPNENMRVATHHIFNTTRASSDIRLGSHGGSHTTLTVTGPT